MLALYLLRHGESAPGNSLAGDIGRKLTSVGKEKLIKLASTVKSRNIRFDLILVSPATRTLETKQMMEHVLGGIESEVDEKIYEGSPRDLVEAICRQPKTKKSILLIGHNPGISAIASYFSGEDFIRLAPGMMASIFFNLDDWRMLSSNSGTLMEILH